MIEKTLNKLRQLTQADIQPQWFFSSDDLSIEQINLADFKSVQLNDKGYITWSAGHQVQWLAQKLVIPYDLQGYPLEGLALRIVLTWWAEDAKIFIDGKLVQEGDLFDSSTRVLLTPTAISGQEIFIALRLVSPGHDIGALMRSKLVYERIDYKIDPGFVADELTVLYNYLQAFEPEKLNFFEEVISQINWDSVNNAREFERSLNTLRQTLQPLAENLKQRTLNLLGHAHLDMAWLWPVNETWDVAQRTFTSVLNLQKEFPELTFCHSTPALYEWVQNNRPDLFTAIQASYNAKSWEVLGGMWIEPEVNLISGESIVRQLLYGQRYIKAQFGEITKVAWLPDSFGFPWQLPQILKQSGIDYFVTGKLHWNDSTKFPYGLFWWQSPDGTEVLTLISPPNVAGVMDTNPIIMSNYAIDWEQQTGLKEAFWLPGVGDHGGGPTRDMLEVARRWQRSPFFPNIQFTTATNYLQKLHSSFSSPHPLIPSSSLPSPPHPLIPSSSLPSPPPPLSPHPLTPASSPLPRWNDELYLEFHRGCYTTHGDQKRFNRYCEGLLYQAELWSSLATISLNLPYPKIQLETAWKKVLFNQFHDILPGTSIREVFEEANQDWQGAIQTGKELLNVSLQAIASNMTLPPSPHFNARPVVIFNSLNWERSEVVSLSIPAGNWEIYDLDGNKVLSQSQDGNLLFFAQNIPSIGYRLFWLCPSEQLQSTLSYTEFILENEQIKVIINPETGDLDSIFDKINTQEILQGKGNQLQAFQDGGQYWDAWNIDPNYYQYPLPPTQLKSIEYLECGVVQSRVRVIRQLGNSEFCQDYILQVNSPILKIVTTVDWQESHVLVKAAFPLSIESNKTTYEIACGVIERTNKPETSAEKAKWEVSALRWADLTDNEQNYGVSLLNDCKYGYDSQSNLLRLTLLRSPQWPDPQCDRSIHQFTYAIYPHASNWQTAKTVQRGYELNIPLLACFATVALSQILPTSGRWLDIEAENLILMAFKASEDNSNQWILRCYESLGQVASLSLESDLDLVITHAVDLLEQPIQENTQVQPWKIASFGVNIK